MSEYPSEADLERIRKWDYHDPLGLLEFIRPFWEHYGRMEITGKRVKRVYLATGGWSGNEDIVEGLKNIRREAELRHHACLLMYAKYHKRHNVLSICTIAFGSIPQFL